jgi:hypothetical protein
MSKNKPTVWQWMATAVANVKAAIGIIPKKVKIYVSRSLEITTAIKNVLNNPVTDIITAIIPSTWDDEAVAFIRASIEKALPYLYIVDKCDSDNLEDMLQCWVTELRKMPEHTQNAMLLKLASLLTAMQDKDALRQRLYDLYVQLQYVENKG